MGGGCVGFGVGAVPGCVGFGVGVVPGCVVGDGCVPFVAEGDAFAVGDKDGFGVVPVPCVVPVVGVLPPRVEVVPVVGALAVCCADCFML